MQTHHSNASPDQEKARKNALLRDAEFYRAGVAHARAQIKHGARPEVLFHSVVDHATWVLRARADALLKPTGTSITALAPYAMTILGVIRKKRLGKPALAITALAAVAGWYVQRKRAKAQDVDLAY